MNSLIESPVKASLTKKENKEAETRAGLLSSSASLNNTDAELLLDTYSDGGLFAYAPGSGMADPKNTKAADREFQVNDIDFEDAGFAGDDGGQLTLGLENSGLNDDKRVAKTKLLQDPKTLNRSLSGASGSQRSSNIGVGVIERKNGAVKKKSTLSSMQ